MKNFVIFFKLNSRFIIKEEAESEEEAIQKVSNRFGLDPRYLEAIEKKSKK